MVTTRNLGITLVEQAQAQKEITINQALVALDVLAGNAVADKDLATPPGSPTTGVLYIVAASPTGAWTGKAKNLAYFDQVWRFIAPQAGMCLWVHDETSFYRYNGTSWVIVSGGGGGGSGDMLQATYDPAGLAQQVVGTSATQTLTNKTINGASNTLTVRLANDVSGTLPVANGGTGKTSIAANNVVLGNGTSALAEVAPGTTGNVLTSNGTTWVSAAPSGGGGGGSSSGSVCNARLTLTSDVPVTTSDVTAAGSVYVTPFRGYHVALYDGTSAWTVLGFTQLTISLASGYTSGKPYDVFLYNNAGSVAVETLVWTNDTTRATALAVQDGVYVKSGATTRRYIGTFYTTSSTTTEDSAAKRYVWNYYNRATRALRFNDSTASWNYSTASWRQLNGASTNQFDFIVGASEDMLSATMPPILVFNSTSSYRSIAVAWGMDSTTAPSGDSVQVENRVSSANNGYASALFEGYPSVGRHTLALLEKGAGADTQSWIPSNSSGYSLFGGCGRLLG